MGCQALPSTLLVGQPFRERLDHHPPALVAQEVGLPVGCAGHPPGTLTPADAQPVNTWVQWHGCMSACTAVCLGSVAVHGTWRTGGTYGAAWGHGPAQLLRRNRLLRLCWELRVAVMLGVGIGVGIVWSYRLNIAL